MRIATLVSAGVDADGNLHEYTEGYRYACQRCPCVYSFSKTGAFQQDRRSQPLTPEVPASYVEDVTPDPNGAIPPAYQRPIPKTAPRV